LLDVSYVNFSFDFIVARMWGVRVTSTLAGIAGVHTGVLSSSPNEVDFVFIFNFAL
jgi:hypothetical protein